MLIAQRKSNSLLSCRLQVRILLGTPQFTMTKWNDIQVGDFFTANINMGIDTLLYQKISCKGSLQEQCNAVLLNTGELCNIYIGSESEFHKVEVTFEIK